MKNERLAHLTLELLTVLGGMALEDSKIQELINDDLVERLEAEANKMIASNEERDSEPMYQRRFFALLKLMRLKEQLVDGEKEASLVGDCYLVDKKKFDITMQNLQKNLMGIAEEIITEPHNKRQSNTLQGLVNIMNKDSWDAYRYYQKRFKQKYPEFLQNMFSYDEFITRLDEGGDLTNFQRIMGYTLGDIG